MTRKKKEEKSNNFFQDNNYAVVKEAVPKEVASFVYAYFQNKRAVASYLKETKYISPFDDSWGTWEDKQMPGTYCHYADLAMETLMVRVMPIMKHVTGLDLIPCYTYARIYKYGDILTRHKDRDSCEISCTINLGGDRWPIFLEPSGETGKEGVEVDLDPGDMLTYKGTLLEHWRDPFQGHDCGQVFLHYNDANGPFKKENLNDKRPMLGLPTWYKNG
tara:strand:+ start:2264 stop:2917 length:654 start_codon:yes stop_codon:yes gene_type:complete